MNKHSQNDIEFEVRSFFFHVHIFVCLYKNFILAFDLQLLLSATLSPVRD